MLTSTAITNALAAENRNFIYTVTITLTDETVLTITNDRIWSGGFEYEDAISEESDFQLGAAIINKFSLTINNMDETYSSYDFTMADVSVTVGVSGGSVQRGKYIVNEAIYDEPLITLECYDYMMRFDQPYSLSTTVYTNGVTLGTILREACSDCDVTQYTTNFTNAELVIYKKPDGETTTFRDVISWIAQIAGCYARCDVQGRLVLSRLPASSSAGHTVTGIFNHSVSVNPITFTGIAIMVADGDNGSVNKYTYGTDGYVINIADNPFITPDNVATVGSTLWTYAQLLNGTFYKGTVSHLCNPLIEAGDKIRFTDRNGNAYDVMVSKTTFTSNEQQTTVSSAKDPARSYSGAMSPATKTAIKSQQLVFNEMTLREQSYSVLENAINVKSGLYMTVETATSGNIYYMHDQPLLADSHLVWKMTSDAFAVTDDYNGADPSATEWDAGLTVDGILIAKIMDTIGINFDWGVGGSLVIKDENNNETFYADADTGMVRINANSLSISGSSVVTNLLKSPYDLTSSYWVKNGTTTGNQADPEGGNNAVKIEKTSSSGAETNLSSNTSNNNPIQSVGQRYKFSVWLKADSDTTVYIALNNTYCRELVSVTTSWRRYTIETYVNTITSNNQVTIGAWGSWTTNGAIYIYNPVVEYADPYMNQEETFNSLTDNNTDDGIYLENGDLYIKFNRAKGGTLTLGGTNNANGVLNVVGTNYTGTLDNAGLRFVDNYGSFDFGPGYFKTESSLGSIYIKNYSESGGVVSIEQPHICGGNGDNLDFRVYNSSGSSVARLVMSPTESYKFVFNNNVKIDSNLYVTGNITVDGIIDDTSDERLKNICEWTASDDFLSEVEPIQFTWKDWHDDGKIHYGFGAQSVDSVLQKYGMDDSSIVTYNYEEDKYYINYIEFIPLLTKKVQTLESENKELKTQLADMESRLEKLEKLISNNDWR